MGGMFDPVHLGHLEVARQVHELLGLDLVLLVPCGVPVHRGAAQASAADRSAMLDLAVAGTPWLAVDRRECASAAPSWTHATLTSLRAERPADSLYLILGADAFLGLPTWHRWQELPGLAHLVVCTRPGVALDAAALEEPLAGFCRQHRVDDAAQLAAARAGGLYLAQLDTPPLSSTLVRERIARGADTAALLPPAVAAYVAGHRLYQSPHHPYQPPDGVNI